MRIGTVDDLARAIGFDPGVRTVELQAAVETATQNLIGELGTELDRAVVTDTFFVPPGASLPMGTLYRTRLALSRGFLDGNATVLFGGLPTEVTMALPLGATIITNEEKGEVIVTGPDLQSQYVTVSYTAGFDIDENDADTYAGLPSWLTEIGTMAALAALDANTPNVRYDLKNRQAVLEAQASARALQVQVSGRLSSKARFFPNHVRPL